MKFTFNTSPVTHSEYTTLRMYSMVMFTYIHGSDQYLPMQANPIINVKALVDFFIKYGTGKSGIRFYPGFNGQKLVILMCSDHEISAEHTDNWCMLDRGFYLEPDADLVNISREEANALHNAYLTQILIDGNPHAPSPTFRLSRFYSWNEVMSYFNDNLQGGNFDEYFIQLEWGFVPEEMAPEFNERYPVGGSEYHQGFTVIMHVKDKDGNPLIDVQQPYQTGQYSRSYLEVGSPCPPRCGEI